MCFVEDLFISLPERQSIQALSQQLMAALKGQREGFLCNSIFPLSLRSLSNVLKFNGFSKSTQNLKRQFDQNDQQVTYLRKSMN